MRKNLLLSLPILLSMIGVVWSAPAPPEQIDLQAIFAQETVPAAGNPPAAVDMAKAPPPSPCTVSCPEGWSDPSITCSSQTGDCHLDYTRGLFSIRCDGVSTWCPYP